MMVLVQFLVTDAFRSGADIDDLVEDLIIVLAIEFKGRARVAFQQGSELVVFPCSGVYVAPLFSGGCSHGPYSFTTLRVTVIDSGSSTERRVFLPETHRFSGSCLCLSPETGLHQNDTLCDRIVLFKSKTGFLYRANKVPLCFFMLDAALKQDHI